MYRKSNKICASLVILINEGQTGFMDNRFIGDNIRLIYDIISYVNNNKMSDLLLCLDFEKAFDSLDWEFIVKVLYAFGFGSDICQWLETFYRDIRPAVSINGRMSS